jgi:TonB family protein
MARSSSARSSTLKKYLTPPALSETRCYNNYDVRTPMRDHHEFSNPQGRVLQSRKLLKLHMVFATRTRMEMLVVVTLLGLTRISSGADNDKPTGKKLIEKARMVSDIRTEGAPSFRMEGTFRISPKKGGKEIQGGYTEIWISKSKWRREVQTSSFHRIEVGAPAKTWLADSGTDRPDAALYGPLSLVFSQQPPEMNRVSRRELDSIQAICAESKGGWSRAIDCFDPDSGFFLLQENLFNSPNNLPSVRHSCVYRNYEGFGDRLFPRSIRCTNDPGDDVELTIAKLVTEGSPEESLFSQPPGAVETRTCQGGVSAPRALLQPEPVYPAHHNENVTVVLSITVGEDGKPLNPEVARSGGKDFDHAALDAIRNWRFQPAKCDGAPYPAKVNVEMNMRNF